MISLRYYLDTRRPSHRPDGKFPLKLAVTKRGDTALLSVSAWATREEWDAKAQRVRGGRFGRSGELNDYLARLMLKFEDAVRALTLDGDGPAMTATQVRDHLAGRIFDAPPGITLGQYFAGFEGRGGENTRRTFENARKAAERALPGIMDRPLASVTTRDVARIDAAFRATCKPSTRNTYAGKLRQVLRAAHREGLTAADAGRELKIGVAATRSRALTADQMRVFMWQHPDGQLDAEALDFFRLSFYLRAINPVDLLRVGPGDVFNGRLTYTRAKTGKVYSVRVEPEAAEIIARRGDERHLFAIPRALVPKWYQRNVCNHLRDMAEALGLPPVTMYWARHTFASLMLETGAPVEVIAEALGHSYGPKVTMGYVTIRERAVDKAVRKVYDLLAEKEKGTK